jgi:hypothetical protein
LESNEANPHPVPIPPRPRRRRRLWPWLIGSPIFLFMAVAIGSWIYLSRMVDHRLADAIAAADRDDPHWRIDDLMANRESVPDAENSAIVVSEALKLLPESWPFSPRPPRGQPLPIRTKIEEISDRLLERAMNVFMDEEEVQVLRDELDTHQEAVRIARTVADYPRGRHELILGPTLIDTLLRETQRARNAARLLSADAALRAHDGDFDGAIDSCRAILCVGRSIGDEPFLISMLVRISIGHVAMNSTWQTLGLGEASDESLARLQALMLDELGQPLLVNGLKGERAILPELIRRIGEGELPIDSLSGLSPKPGQKASRERMAPWGHLGFKYQRALAIEWMNQLIAIARRPTHEQPPLIDAWQAEFDQVKKSRLGPYTTTLPILVIPAVSAARSAFYRYQGELSATILLLAAERHRRKTGEWPLTLAAIDPAILRKPPVDPFSGQPFLMKHAEGRFIIYSIGPDHKDEGGTYDPKKWDKGGSDDVGAIGWDVEKRKQPAKPER